MARDLLDAAADALRFQALDVAVQLETVHRHLDVLARSGFDAPQRAQELRAAEAVASAASVQAWIAKGRATGVRGKAEPSLSALVAWRRSLRILLHLKPAAPVTSLLRRALQPEVLRLGSAITLLQRALPLLRHEAAALAPEIDGPAQAEVAAPLLEALTALQAQADRTALASREATRHKQATGLIVEQLLRDTRWRWKLAQQLYPGVLPDLNLDAVREAQAARTPRRSKRSAAKSAEAEGDPGEGAPGGGAPR